MNITKQIVIGDGDARNVPDKTMLPYLVYVTDLTRV